VSGRLEPPPRGERTYLNAARRSAELEALADGAIVDVLVIGGGVTGAGVALDAVTRGLSVALIERRDLAAGTSGFSSKLAHGGLRYLSNLQFDVAWESARERATLATATAPHLVRALPQLTIVSGRFPPPVAAAFETGIRMGDAMRALSGTSRRRLPAMRRISAAEARIWAPELSTSELRGAILSWDGLLEDDALLVIALARTAAAHGVRVLTYCEATELTGEGARVRDVLGDASFELRARHVVNATGVWADTLVDTVKLRPSKGAHLLVRAERLGYPRAMMNVGMPGHFGRFLFAIPRPDDLVLIGVTDDPFEGPIPDTPPVDREDERFLLETLSLGLQRPLDSLDVVASFAGLRPLLDSGSEATADLSRRHAVLEDPATRAITVVGGKLTTYRQMAQDAVDLIAARPGVGAGPCRTRALPVVGAQAVAGPAPAGVPARLVSRFGAEAQEIAALAAGDPELLEPLAPEVPALGVEVLAAVQREGAVSADDVLDRRSRLGLVPTWREAGAPAVEQLLASLAEVPA